MNKKELIEAVSDLTGLSLRSATTVVDAIIATIEDQLASGDKVQITNFGTLEIKERAAKSGYDFVTGQRVAINPQRTIVFKPGKGLKDRVDAGM